MFEVIWLRAEVVKVGKKADKTSLYYTFLTFCLWRQCWCMRLSCFPSDPESKAYSGFGWLTCQWIKNESFLLADTLLINHLLKLCLTQILWRQWHCVPRCMSCTISLEFSHYVYGTFISFLSKWQYKPQAYKKWEILPRPCVFANWAWLPRPLSRVWRNCVEGKQMVTGSHMYSMWLLNKTLSDSVQQTLLDLFSCFVMMRLWRLLCVLQFPECSVSRCGVIGLLGMVIEFEMEQVSPRVSEQA